MFERLKFHQTGGQLLFHLISPPYERTSVIITTNLAFGDWPCVLPHRHSAHAAMAGDPGIITAALIENQGSPETPPGAKRIRPSVPPMSTQSGHVCRRVMVFAVGLELA